MIVLDRIIWLLTALILAGMLSGCSSVETGDQVWYKSGGTVEERDRLLAAAQVQAAQAHATATPGAPDQPHARRQTEREAVITTMTAAGWHLVSKSQAEPLKNKKEVKPPPRSLSAPTALDR